MRTVSAGGSLMGTCALVIRPFIGAWLAFSGFWSSPSLRVKSIGGFVILCTPKQAGRFSCPHLSRGIAFVFVCAILFLMTPEVAFADALGVQKGRASWYGTTAHGKKTANGEIFQYHEFSAAHRTLPFGTIVRVHHAANNRQVLVRINDRGPYKGGRVIDLSKRAARTLNMIRSGVAQVVFETVADPSGRPLNRANSFYIRVADTDSEAEVRKLSSKIESVLKRSVHALTAESPKKNIALCVGPFATFAEAEKAVDQIEKHYEVKDIIEAPTKGGVLPFYGAPGRRATPASLEANGVGMLTAE